jgi:predicted metal-dependent peptidase
MSSTKPAGGGGTSAECIPKYIEQHKLNPECVIVLTDGYIGGWGDWKHPVFWGMTTDMVAPMGISVKIEEN